MIDATSAAECAWLGLLITHNKLPFCLRKRQPNRINVGFSRVLKFNTLNRSPNHEIFSSAKEREDFNDNEPEPFWHSWMYPVKDVVRELWSLVVFLMEQPSQLKYIEWPTFRSTLKTAILTLVLVAALIVVLSTIDSFLIYTLALLLRRPA
ncbi:hypothetical protein ZOSMA_83G00330 [Zostera marina]|uniref:Preprotein translocase subunit SecE n=1 Tax=Zostera marina TaxID=29655 RepID=A0A0K9NNL8_ZOSMR|nr:hypothetical protein ZOSMA_83G00330 [Zostera marina]